ncbi:hypothetical protein [Crinalium epipsammum]|nr:hypothetical protein [Crinalium epipsammum]
MKNIYQLDCTGCTGSFACGNYYDIKSSTTVFLVFPTHCDRGVWVDEK